MTAKKIKIAFVFFQLILVGVPSAFGKTNFTLPVPEIETLPNGLQVVWFLNDSLPVLDLGLLVKAGYRDDAKGKSGTAQLLSAVLDRGAGELDAAQLARAVEGLGATRYAAADDDTFTVGIHGLAPDADQLLSLFTKIVLNPRLSKTEIQREHTRLSDRWQHVGDYGDALASLAYSRIIASGTDYGRGNFVSSKEFQSVGASDVVSFYKTYFVPVNSVLMIVGRVNKVEFRKKILSNFGEWQGTQREVRRNWQKFSFENLKPKKGQIFLVEREKLTQSQVRIGFKSAPLKAPQHYSLVVGNVLIGEYFNSRLTSIIRDRLGLTYSIGSSFTYSKDFARFTISSATRNESTGQLIRKVLEILRDLKNGNISDDEVKMAKEYLIGGFPLGVSTLGAVALRWLSGYVYDLGPSYLNEFVPKVEAVSKADVVSALAKDIDLEDVVIVVAGEPKEIGASLKASRFNSVKRVKIKDLL